jgi:hypothetical protein
MFRRPRQTFAQAPIKPRKKAAADYLDEFPQELVSRIFCKNWQFFRGEFPL